MAGNFCASDPDWQANKRLITNETQHRLTADSIYNTLSMERPRRTPRGSLEPTEASARWSALNGTRSQRSVRTAHPISMTQKEGEAYLSSGLQLSQAIHTQGTALEQNRAEITSIHMAGLSISSKNTKRQRQCFNKLYKGGRRY